MALLLEADLGRERGSLILGRNMCAEENDAAKDKVDREMRLIILIDPTAHQAADAAP